MVQLGREENDDLVESLVFMLEYIDKEIAAKIIAACSSNSYTSGQIIFSEGQSADRLPIVKSGKVKMVRYPEPGKEIIIGTFQSGEAFAIPPALDGKAFPSTAVAMEPTTILFLPRARFLEIMSESPSFSSFILGRACGILRDRSETLNIFAQASAESRIAGVILSLVDGEGGKTPFTVRLRRQDIAEMAGLTLEAAIRTVRKLHERGVIDIEKRKIVVVSTEGLRELVG